MQKMKEENTQQSLENYSLDQMMAEIHWNASRLIYTLDGGDLVGLLKDWVIQYLAYRKSTGEKDMKDFCDDREERVRKALVIYRRSVKGWEIPPAGAPAATIIEVIKELDPNDEI